VERNCSTGRLGQAFNLLDSAGKLTGGISTFANHAKYALLS
jgi:hypothetical protein